jgi:hypothetical protein
MKTVVIFCAIAFTFSCSRKTVVVGTYSAKSNPDSFQINSDSTFYYKYSAYHLSEFSSGRWRKLSNNRVVLNSGFQDKYLPLKVSYIAKSIREGLELNLHFDVEMPLGNYKCAIFLNDTLYRPIENRYLSSTGISVLDFGKSVNVNDFYSDYTRCDSLLSLKFPVTAQSFFFKIVKVPLEVNTTSLIKYSLQTEKYNLLHTDSSQIEVNLSFKDFLFNYRIFKNEELKVKNSRISIFNINTGRWWDIPKSFSHKS